MIDSRVAVVTPVYNGARFLARTIESVINQSHQSWEYVIVDGGSSDGSREIAEGYAKRDARIRVISGRDRGMYDAVFRGFDATSAEICCWINADDMYMPWAFSVVDSYMSRAGVRWISGLAGFWDERDRLIHVSTPIWRPRWVIRAGLCQFNGIGLIQQESSFFDRSLLRAASPDFIEYIRTLKYAGDFLLWTEFAKYAEQQCVDTVLAGFRIHSANASQNLSAYDLELRRSGIRVLPSAARFLMRLIPIHVLRALGRARARKLRLGTLETERAVG